MKFEKLIGNIALCGVSVAKYTDDETGEIKLVKEENGEPLGELLFESSEEYSEFIDQNTDDQDWTYNQSAVVNKLIELIPSYN